MRIFLFLILFFSVFQTYSQIVYEYDAAGNRTVRTILDMSNPVVSRSDSSSTTDSTLAERNEFTYQFTEGAKITVYPNPATQYINVQSENISIVEITIFDYSGKQLLSRKSTESFTNINVSFLPYGNYIMTTVADGKRKEWKMNKN